jgi:Na+-transporting NADH:ubiquinone oxidoreductase subunit F
MIFIAGGSGMAPFCSMLARMKAEKNPRRTRYFFGARAVRDLFYVEQMRAYEQALPDFRFIPALSDPAPDDDWDGETGLITDVVGRHYEDCSDKEAYLCGSPGMIDACIKVLAERGMPEEQVFYDKFA